MTNTWPEEYLTKGSHTTKPKTHHRWLSAGLLIGSGLANKPGHKPLLRI